MKWSLGGMLQAAVTGLISVCVCVQWSSGETFIHTVRYKTFRRFWSWKATVGSRVHRFSPDADLMSSDWAGGSEAQHRWWCFPVTPCKTSQWALCPFPVWHSDLCWPSCGAAASSLPGRVGDEPLKPAAHGHVHSEHECDADQQGHAAHQEAWRLKHQPGRRKQTN